MTKKLERFGPVLAGAVLIWFGWSALDDGSANALIKKPEEKEELPRIKTSLLRKRQEGEEVVVSRDPFEASWAARLGISAPVKAVSIDADTDEDDEPKEPPRPFTLTLQSVLDLPTGGQARISGRTVAVGAPLDGFDADSPPVLVDVDATIARVRYRGQSYLLDLWNRPEVRIDLTPEEEVRAVRTSSRRTIGGGRGRRRTSTRSGSAANAR